MEQSRRKRWIKDPLLHFLLAGGALFGAYAWLNPKSDDTTRDAKPVVRIDQKDVEWLRNTWTLQWQREPTRDELHGLVTDFLREELLCREAREMGLDENDLIVRRRLAQKLSFLIEDTARLAEPTEDDLRRLFGAHPERFETEATISFTHIFFNRERREDALADAKSALVLLSTRNPAADASRFGDPLLIGSEFQEATEQSVSSVFGTGFAQSVFALPPETWHGPVESGFGLHLVFVSDIQPKKRMEFADVRAQVLQRWRDEQQRDSNQRFFAALLNKYDIEMAENVKALIGTIDGPLTRPSFGTGETQ